jgi:hypothetical protein
MKIKVTLGIIKCQIDRPANMLIKRSELSFYAKITKNLQFIISLPLFDTFINLNKY